MWFPFFIICIENLWNVYFWYIAIASNQPFANVGGGILNQLCVELNISDNQSGDSIVLHLINLKMRPLTINGGKILLWTNLKQPWHLGIVQYLYQQTLHSNLPEARGRYSTRVWCKWGKCKETERISILTLCTVGMNNVHCSPVTSWFFGLRWRYRVTNIVTNLKTHVVLAKVS